MFLLVHVLNQFLTIISVFFLIPFLGCEIDRFSGANKGLHISTVWHKQMLTWRVPNYGVFCVCTCNLCNSPFGVEGSSRTPRLVSRVLVQVRAQPMDVIHASNGRPRCVAESRFSKEFFPKSSMNP